MNRDEAPDDGPDYYDFPKNWKEKETEETHDKNKQAHSFKGLINDGSHAPHTDTCITCGYTKAAAIHKVPTQNQA